VRLVPRARYPRLGGGHGSQESTPLKGTEEQRRARLIYCAVPLAIFTVSSTVGAMFMPYLLARKPLLLVALSPLFRHLVLAAPSLNAVSLFAVAVPRHFVVDPFVYLLGRDYGPIAVEWIETNSPGVGKLVRALERLFGKIGPVALLVSPDVVVSTLAGAARVPFPLFVVMNLVGTVATVTVARWFGNALEVQIHAIVVFFQGHLVAVTAASVLMVLAFNAWSRRKPPE
jgi:membrane protein DedA with SNARE-associated domain